MTDKSSKQKDKKKKHSQKCQRTYAINMPEMHWGGLSENWLQKEFGDMHWALIAKGLGVKSDELVDAKGERLYASFVRLRWEASESLYNFKENQKIKLTSKLSRYGGKMFFSNVRIKHKHQAIRAKLMSVFSTRNGRDNQSLKKGTPLVAEAPKIPRLKKLPDFANEYMKIKLSLNTPTEKQTEIKLGGVTFHPSTTVLFTKDYLIEPYDDVNGVGLLYFASYAKISDKCERQFFHQLLGENKELDWAENSACLARDIFYFGNANPEETLRYELNDYQFLDEKRLKLTSSLYRKGDGELIAEIFSIKKLQKLIKF